MARETAALTKMEAVGPIAASWPPAIAARRIMALVATRMETLQASLGLLVSVALSARCLATFTLRVEAKAMDDAHDLPGG